ncbi:MAG: type II toxin-antitoxin system RatA family toxin [Micavibrio sp.]|nr:type II toxin-antitoxin system RatA family toxin [Micavibrio sp.]
MPKVHDSRVIRMPKRKIYDLMMDIEAYPRFIPFIRAARVLEKRDDGLLAEIRVGVPGLAFTYRCEVTATPHEQIDVKDVAGPFRFLKARMTFSDTHGGTKVDYYFESQFRSHMMNAVADPIFTPLLQSTLAGIERFIGRKKP